MQLLIVDDEPDIVRVIPLLFPEHTWAQAYSGQEALHIMREHLPDLILLDVLMPDMDGLEVLHAMKADPMLAAIPVILLTALGQRDQMEAGHKAGATRYILKPFNIKALQYAIDDVLASKM